MKSLKLLSVLSIAGILSACGGGGSGSSGPSSTNAPAQYNTAAGTVLFNSAPLAGATVTAFNTNSDPSTVFATTTTDASGHYSFSGLSANCTSPGCVINYQFMATKAGYAFNPVMASNPTASRAGYLWVASAHNWYVNTGAAVTRAGYNSIFTNGFGGPGISFNVINLNSVPNNSITGANFNAYNGSNPLVSLAASGQTISFVGGDDGALAKGMAWPSTRFADNADGTVTDNLTGLVWLKNAGCFVATLWATALTDANQLASGACGLSDGSQAGDWRLPNIVELESVVDASTSSPAITVGSPFVNVSNGIYWSSTSYYAGIGGSPQAWAIQMSDGRYINDNGSSISNLKASSLNNVWAVKGKGGGTVKLQASGLYEFYASGDDGSVEAGVPLPAPRMRDNGNGTVTDTLTGLIWLKQADCLSGSWTGAIGAASALAAGQCGLTDGSTAGQWRMPNRKEMQSLADRMQNNMADYLGYTFTSTTAGVNSQPAIFTNFIQSQYYWTSTTDAASVARAWTVFSCDFGVYDTAKASTGYTLAVR